jgi:hypothetical protein
MRLILLGLVAVAGCADQAAQTPQEKAEAYFDDNVYPLLVQQCASCHTSAGVVFMGTDAGSTYVDLTNSTLVDNFDTSAPLLRVMMTGEDHPTPVFPAPDTDVVVQWFDLERGARGL